MRWWHASRSAIPDGSHCETLSGLQCLVELQFCRVLVNEWSWRRPCWSGSVSMHGAAPAYLSDLCIPATAISGWQHLRSATTGTLLVPRAWTATGQPSFAVEAPTTLNSLRLYYGHQTCHRTLSSGHWLRIACSQPSGAIKEFCTILAPDNQTYLLTCYARNSTHRPSFDAVFLKAIVFQTSQTL